MGYPKITLLENRCIPYEHMTTILKFRHLLETHFKCILKFGEGDGGGGKFCGLDYSGSETYVINFNHAV